MMNGIPVDKDLACAIGFKESIFLQGIKECLSTKPPGIDFYFEDGRWWIHSSIYELWRTIYPFSSETTIKRKLRKLQELKLLIVKNSTQDKQRQYYTINFAVLDGIIAAFLERKEDK